MPRKIVFAGYGPDDQMSLEERTEQWRLFADNLELLLAHRAEILERESWFYCELARAYLSVAYIGWGGQIPLGVLLLLWEHPEWREVCSECGEEVLIVGAGGSPLSGSNRWWGICRGAACREQPRTGFRDGRKNSFWSILKPARMAMQEYRNPWILDVPPPQPWSWTKPPEPVEPPKPYRQILPAKLGEIVATLKLERALAAAGRIPKSATDGGGITLSGN